MNFDIENVCIWLHRISALVILLGITIADILIVEMVFRPTGIWGYIRYYHVAVFQVLVPAIVIAGFLMTRDWHFSLYLLILLLLGVEDTLYYLLQGKVPPEKLPWIWGAPTRIELIIRNILAFLLIITLEYLDSKYAIWLRFKRRILSYVSKAG